MPKTPAVTSDIKILRTIQWIGSILAVEMLVLNILFGIYLIESSSMGEMLDLSRSMNTSTSATMARAHELMSGVNPEDVSTIVGNARLISTDVNSILGPIAQHGNISALVTGVQKVAGAIDAHAVAAVVADAASIMHTASAGVGALNLPELARRVVELIQIVNPAEVRVILSDIQNVTAETRKIVDGLAMSHNVQLTF